MRYSPVAILLHWLIAAALVAVAPLGWWMSDAVQDPDRRQAAYQAYQLHKSLGFAILALSLGRVAWRLLHPVPPLPAAMGGFERFAARAAHAAFYALLILLPLSGWLYVSAGWAVGEDRPLAVATSWFGLFEVPHLPGVADASEAARRTIAVKAMSAHGALAWGAVLLSAVHVLAALKHHFVDRDAVLASMWPWSRRRGTARAASGPTVRPAAAGIGAVVALGLAAAMFARSAPPPASAPRVVPPPKVREAPIVPGRAAAWIVDPTASRIGFSGLHAGAGFEGRFEAWTAHIWFDPADLAGSRAVVLVRTGSVRTDDPTHEASLAQGEWFDPAGFPIARFEAATFRAVGPGRYEAVGTLRVKDRAAPVTLPFTLEIDGDRAAAAGRVRLDRVALDLGMASDPAAEWVSRLVQVDIRLSARRARG